MVGFGHDKSQLHIWEDNAVKRMVTLSAGILFAIAFAKGESVSFQAELETAMLSWGDDAVNLADAVDNAFGKAYNSAERGLFLPLWYCTIMNASIPTDWTLAERSKWTGVKAHASSTLMSSEYVQNDTNCWLAASQLHGQIIANESISLSEMAGIDTNLLLHASNDVLIIDSPMPSSQNIEMSPMNRIADAVELKRQLSRLKVTLVEGLKKSANSDVFRSLDVDSHNAMVSNLVAIGCFAQQETIYIGLTNINHQITK